MVSSLSELRRAVGELQKTVCLGVDLEADSMFHYKERVCLLQVAAGDRTLLIDPLSVEDLAPLAPVFGDPRTGKVLHGADYDVRSLHRDFAIEVEGLFDTQIAARFCGYAQTGLADLLDRFFGIKVEKKYQKKDWSVRPLPLEMLTYAAEDVRHLVPLATLLKAELEKRGRLSWVEEECLLASRVRSVAREGVPFHLRFKGAGRLDPRSLAVLEELLGLRDALARERNCPPFKVLESAPLLEMALKKPLSMEHLEAIEGLPAKRIRDMGRPLVEAVRKALRLPARALPAYPRGTGKRHGAVVERRVQALRKWRNEAAESLEMDPALVCTNAQVLSIALADPRNPEDLAGIKELRNWQREALGEAILMELGSSEGGRSY